MMWSESSQLLGPATSLTWDSKILKGHNGMSKHRRMKITCKQQQHWHVYEEVGRNAHVRKVASMQTSSPYLLDESAWAPESAMRSRKEAPGSHKP